MLAKEELYGKSYLLVKHAEIQLATSTFDGEKFSGKLTIYIDMSDKYD